MYFAPWIYIYHYSFSKNSFDFKISYLTKYAGILALPVKLYQCGFAPFVVTFSFALIAQVQRFFISSASCNTNLREFRVFFFLFSSYCYCYYIIVASVSVGWLISSSVVEIVFVIFDQNKFSFFSYQLIYSATNLPVQLCLLLSWYLHMPYLYLKMLHFVSCHYVIFLSFQKAKSQKHVYDEHNAYQLQWITDWLILEKLLRIVRLINLILFFFALFRPSATQSTTIQSIFRSSQYSRPPFFFCHLLWCSC